GGLANPDQSLLSPFFTPVAQVTWTVPGPTSLPGSLNPGEQPSHPHGFCRSDREADTSFESGLHDFFLMFSAQDNVL
ncbi:hypothetical protein scyTo_0016035, partial [Scyliorhinus torazame]|nr:hypothetical protein [Scyliorhinus torazame]